jgi:Response regulators consisting of a CheY-like receiver domain and a winged-helix DNA-binding domain
MSEKILVVDDDVESLKLISLMLKRQGYDVAIANSGVQALSKALAEMPNLIILDIMMMDMDGYEVCRRLRANPETRPIPIIMFTAKTLIDDKVAGFEAGADDYLTKPTHPAEWRRVSRPCLRAIKRVRKACVHKASRLACWARRAASARRPSPLISPPRINRTRAARFWSISGLARATLASRSA